jgi:hypothetical protein
MTDKMSLEQQYTAETGKEAKVNFENFDFDAFKNNHGLFMYYTQYTEWVAALLADRTEQYKVDVGRLEGLHIASESLLAQRTAERDELIEHIDSLLGFLDGHALPLGFGSLVGQAQAAIAKIQEAVK